MEGFIVDLAVSKCDQRPSAKKFLGRTTEKTRPKNNTIKPPSTLLVSCMKIQGGHGSPLPTPMNVTTDKSKYPSLHHN